METATLLIIVVLVVALAAATVMALRGRENAAREDATAAQLTRLEQQTQQALAAMTQNLTAHVGLLQQTMDRRLADSATQLTAQLGTATQSVAAVQKMLDERLADNTRRLDQRLENAAQSFAHVKELLAKVEASNQRMVEVGRDVASLQNILTAPKLRGGFGELMLGDLLGSMLPPERYALQHRFRSGEIVDALIRLRDNAVISVDSKFPLENFRRVADASTDVAAQAAARRAFVADVKKHVQAIAQKYIVPDEGTLDFALMYIPAENVYYETIVSDKDGHALLEYFFKHRVIPVSPNSFYAYLMTIVFGLRGLRIEEQAREMFGAVERLATEYGRFSEDFDVVGKHIGNAQRKYEEAERRLGRIETHVERLRGRGGAQQVLTDAPDDGTQDI